VARGLHARLALGDRRRGRSAGQLQRFEEGNSIGPTGGLPQLKSRNRSVPSVSFAEINHQLSWLHPDRHHIRLMLPQHSLDADVRRRSANLAWMHTTESTRRLYNLVEQRRARIQKVTISQRGGRWQVAFCVRYLSWWTGSTHRRKPVRAVERREPSSPSARGSSNVRGVARPLTGTSTQHATSPGREHGSSPSRAVSNCPSRGYDPRR
jgi:hypothetical protein